MIDGQALPDSIAGYGNVRPYRDDAIPPAFIERTTVQVKTSGRGTQKLLCSIEAALDACAVQDGATLSFHHHLRNGDQVLNMVLDAAARRGLKDLRIAPSSLFAVHEPLIEHIRSGVVTRVVTSYMTGPVANAISQGVLAAPVVMQTHGGRARAIEAGELHIDVAFIAAPCADSRGNVNGVEGRAACGPLGYAMVDVQFADRVVAITDHLAAFPICPIDIRQDQVDFVVTVESIGDPRGILSGTTRSTNDPIGLRIAATAAQVIEASGLLVDGFSFQTGAGGVSLAVADCLRETMQRHGTVGSFAAGGVTGSLCQMLEQGLFRSIFDVQCFDLAAVESYRRDPRHQAMSASLYANPHSRGALVDMLDAMVLGAAEVDLNFNVNVTTGATGTILGGSGGHADTAAGAKLAIVTTKVVAGGGPKFVERVGCITTPGQTVDVVVTELGVAVNPLRAELADRLRSAGVRTISIQELCAAASRSQAAPPLPRAEGRIVAVLEYRDGSVIDVVRTAA